jgi:hypothetical protein
MVGRGADNHHESPAPTVSTDYLELNAATGKSMCLTFDTRLIKQFGLIKVLWFYKSLLAPRHPKVA